MNRAIYRWSRDVTIMLIVILVIFTWQERDLLDTDGSAVIESQNLVSLSGDVTPLLSTTKTNIIYFFAPWCSVCRYSINNLSSLSEEDVNIVRVALDYSSLESVADFAKEVNVSGKILLGNENIKREFRISGYPTYYIVDNTGVVKAKSMGYSSALGIALRHKLATSAD